MELTGAQCRAARRLLGWSEDRLGNEAKLARGVVCDFENGAGPGGTGTGAAIRAALETAGVVLGGDDGIRAGKAGVDAARDPATPHAVGPEDEDRSRDADEIGAAPDD